MTITNFGSFCIDHVYTVPHFVKPGETLPCLSYQVHPGGKGLNQSLALAYAGASVRHIGKIGSDGVWMRTLLENAGVDVNLTAIVDTPTGHANIQVTPEGENAIVIYGGANQTISRADIELALQLSQPGEYLLIQNEISCLPELIEIAANKQLRIIFNAAPITDAVKDYPLHLIEVFVINEVEGESLTGETEPSMILDAMLNLYPDSKVILTLGQKGAAYKDRNSALTQPADNVMTIDSTGAGDTFTGYFLANYVAGKSIQKCLQTACKAAGISVTRRGAASSIPKLAELSW
jgi:ribokinase